METLPVVAELLRTDGQTHTHDAANNRFRKFSKLRIKILHSLMQSTCKISVNEGK